MKSNQLLNYQEYVKRYRTIIDDFEAFLGYSKRPLPKIVWTNPLKTRPAAIEQLLTAHDVTFQKLSWWPGAFKILNKFKAGRTIEYLNGSIHIQEEVSLLPVLAMNPQKGEKVLDLCAAPGNKSVGIALKMKDQGTVLANDVNSGRIALLQNMLQRLGITNTMITNEDGHNILGIFDKVLVDAPCSAEGNSRKTPWRPRQIKKLKKFQQLQQQLLHHALQLVSQGGSVVYSTCTYAPEENEQVVNSVLNDKVVLEPINFPSEINYATGILEWQGETYHNSIKQCYRFYPHHNNSGGFFIAKLRKL